MNKLLTASLLAALASAAHSALLWSSFNQSTDMTLYGITVEEVKPSAGFQMAYDVSFGKGAYFTVGGNSTKYYVDFIKGFYVVTKSETDYLGVKEYLNVKGNEPAGPTTSNQPVNPTTTYATDPKPASFTLAGAEHWHTDSTSTYGNGAISGNFAGWNLSQTPNGKYSLFAGYTEEFEFTKISFTHAQSGVQFAFDIGLLDSATPGYSVHSFPPPPGFAAPATGPGAFQGFISGNMATTPAPAALATFGIGALGVLRRRFRKA